MKENEIVRLTLEKFTKTSNSNYVYQFVKNRTLINQPHTHTFYEICYAVKGNCTEIRNGKEIVINEGQMSVCCPGACHHFAAQSEDLVIICLSIGMQEFTLFANAIDNKLMPFIQQTSNDQVYCVFGKVPNMINKSPYLISEKDYDFKYLLMFFLINLAKSIFQNTDDDHSNFAMMITKLPYEAIIKGGVSALASLSSYSRSQLTRLMKRYFNKTPWEYVTELRMDYAYNELIHTDEKIETIAERCGFESFGHFSQTFKRCYGESPSVIRKTYMTKSI